MAALEGFSIEIAAGDIEIGPGLVDGVAVPAVVIDVSAESLGDGTHAVITNGTASSVQLAATALASGEFKLGEFVEATAAATSVTFEDRGDTLLVSADETITL